MIFVYPSRRHKWQAHRVDADGDGARRPYVSARPAGPLIAIAYTNNVNWLISFNLESFVGLVSGKRPTHCSRALRNTIHRSRKHQSLGSVAVSTSAFISVIKFIHFYISLIRGLPACSIYYNICRFARSGVLSCSSVRFMGNIFTSGPRLSKSRTTERDKQLLIYLAPARNVRLPSNRNNNAGGFARSMFDRR